ncbi:MAG: PIN domain-containing protein [Sulfurovum sp.]|nr:PIN domain-containing protein [Sulfurovum sp.]
MRYLLKNILIDTGPIVALLNRRDKHHKRVLAFTQNYSGKFITTWSVITEATHLLRHSIQAQLNLLEWIRRGGIEIVQIEKNDIERMLTLTKKYSDLPMNLVDCSLIIVAEKLDIKELISIDSDYDVYRTLKKEALTNLLHDYPL